VSGRCSFGKKRQERVRRGDPCEGIRTKKRDDMLARTGVEGRPLKRETKSEEKESNQKKVQLSLRQESNRGAAEDFERVSRKQTT